VLIVLKVILGTVDFFAGLLTLCIQAGLSLQI
jgi:hypothetical protein